MRAYCFFSVHVQLFDRVAQDMVTSGHLTAVSGFAWGEHVLRTVETSDVPYDRDNMLSFSRDILPRVDRTALDLEWLRRREHELGISLRRAIAAERHLVAGRSYEDVLRLVQVSLRVIDEAYERARPDFIFTEDISCLLSTLHWALARERGIPFWCIGSARLPNRLALYRSGFQTWERCLARYEELHTLTDEQRAFAERFVAEFRERPSRPTGMQTRARIPRPTLADLGTLVRAELSYRRDRDDPTAVPARRAVEQRLTRLWRMRGARRREIFEAPVAGESYVLYPIHFQPEASTLVQAPMYLDQISLIEDIAKSLPVGVHLYVKEHLSNRGRRPLAFYEQIKSICGVRLLGPDEDTWMLLRGADAVAVITGTMGWEGLLFDKPVVVFGDVFYGHLPSVYRALDVPKDRWYELFRQALEDHRPDTESLLRYIVAIQETSFPGFMKNPNTFPQVLTPENVRAIAAALTTVVTEDTPPPRQPRHLSLARRVSAEGAQRSSPT